MSGDLLPLLPPAARFLPPSAPSSPSTSAAPDTKATLGDTFQNRHATADLCKSAYFKTALSPHRYDCFSWGPPRKPLLLPIAGKLSAFSGIKFIRFVIILRRYPFWISPPRFDLSLNPSQNIHIVKIGLIIQFAFPFYLMAAIFSSSSLRKDSGQFLLFFPMQGCSIL